MENLFLQENKEVIFKKNKLEKAKTFLEMKSGRNKKQQSKWKMEHS